MTTTATHHSFKPSRSGAFLVAISLVASAFAPAVSTGARAEDWCAPGGDSNLCFAQGLNQGMANLHRNLNRIEQLGKECEAAWFKSMSSACSELDEIERRTAAANATLDAQLSAQSAMSNIGRSVSRSQQQISNRNMSSHYRQSAQGNFSYADQARRNGDTAAAQRWQERGNSDLRWSYQYR